MEEKKEIKILIADDHDVVRKGIISVLADNPHFTILAEAKNGVEASEYIKKFSPDIAILDIDMPQKDGLAVASECHGSGLPVKVVIITGHKLKEYYDRAMTLDVRAFVLKDNVANELCECIQSVHQGEYYISPAISSFLIKNRQRTLEESGLNKLTQTEKKILKLIAERKTSRQIADELFNSVRTIENHRNNIRQKLGLKGSPHELLLYAIENKSLL